MYCNLLFSDPVLNKDPAFIEMFLSGGTPAVSVFVVRSMSLVAAQLCNVKVRSPVFRPHGCQEGCIPLYSDRIHARTTGHTQSLVSHPVYTHGVDVLLQVW